MLLKTVSFATILTVWMLVGPTDGWVMHAVYHNNAYPGKCFVNENLILSPGQTAKSPEGCSEIQCENAEGYASVIGCSKVESPNNCRWDGLEDEHAPFPLCCVEKFVCDSPADEENAKNLQEHLRNMFRRQLEEKNRQNAITLQRHSNIGMNSTCKLPS